MHGAKRAHLESMRGLAALIVVCAHGAAVFYPFALFGSNGGYVQKAAWEHLFLSTPAGILIAGYSAVCLFFILSGYVLSYKHLGTAHNRAALAGALAKRPFRLGGLVVFTMIVSALLWSNRCYLNTEVSSITQSVPWFSKYWSTGLDMGNLFYEIILNPFAVSQKYNPPLWTITIELYGSLYVFLFLLLFASSRYRIFICLALVLWLNGSFYQGFWLGVLIADLNKHYPRYRRLCAHRYVSCGLLLGGAYLAGYPSFAHAKILSGTIYGWLPKVAATGGGYAMAGALMLFIALNEQPRLQSLLRARGLVALGRISYAVYAVHFLVLGTITSWLFLLLYQRFGYGLSCCAAGAATLAAVLLLAQAATKLVDYPAIRLSGKVASVVTEIIVRITGALQSKAEVPGALMETNDLT